MTVILTFFIITCAPLRSARHDVGNEEIVHLYASLGRDARVKSFALSGMSNALNSSFVLIGEVLGAGLIHGGRRGTS